MTRRPSPDESPLDDALRRAAARLRERAPAHLEGAVLAAVAREREAAAGRAGHPRRDAAPARATASSPRAAARGAPAAWRPLAAAALVLLCAWAALRWVDAARGSAAAAAPLRALHAVTAAPASTVQRLADAPVLRQVRGELRAEVARELADLEAGAGAAARALARGLSGPLDLLTRLR